VSDVRSIPAVAGVESRLAALEAFVSENSDLEELEGILGPFNVFEAMGVTWQELRHSDFLAFLLNPSGSHGLGDLFLKRFLTAVLRTSPHRFGPVSLVDVDVWDLTDTEVRREWRSIDILILSPRNGLVVIIENKVLSGEHDDQLARYWDRAKDHQLGGRIVGVYLSIGGDQPTDERYTPIGYGTVCQVLEGICASRRSVLGADVSMALTHYIQLLRRHVLEESDIARLARRIYEKHRAAVDLIIEHRPDQQADLRTLLEELVGNFEGLISEASTKRYVCFAPLAWDGVIPKAGERWVPSQRMLLFEFDNSADRLFLKLTIGPGPSDVRERLFNAVLHEGHPFDPGQKVLGRGWNTVWRRDILKPGDYEGEMEAIQDKVTTRWRDLAGDELPRLIALISSWGLSRVR